MKKARCSSIILFAAIGGLSTTLAFVACSSSSTPQMSADAQPDMKAGHMDAPNDTHTSSDAPAGDVMDGGSTSANIYAFNGFVTIESPIQFCFTGSASGDPGLSHALPMKPQPADGIQAGLGSAIDVPSLAGLNVRIVAYYTSSLTSLSLTKDTCEQVLALSGLIGDAGVIGDGGTTLLQHLDFEISDVINSSFFLAGTKYLVTAFGCPRATTSAYFPPGPGNPSACGYIETDGGVPDHLGVIWLVAFALESTSPPSGMSRLQASDELSTAAFSNEAFNPPYGVGNFLLSVGYGSLDGGPDAQDLVPLNGPLFTNGGLPVDSGLFGLPDASGPLPPGTDIPPLSTATSLGQTAPLFGLSFGYPIATVLQLSNLTPADLKGTMTRIDFGNPFDPIGPTLADGGLNPRYLGVRLIPNQ
jgi:hypothetical protein